MSRPSPAFLGGCGLLAVAMLLFGGHSRIDGWRESAGQADASAQRQPPVITVRRPASSSEELRRMKGEDDTETVVRSLVKELRDGRQFESFPSASERKIALSLQLNLRDSALPVLNSEIGKLSAEQLRDAIDRVLWPRPDERERYGRVLRLDDELRAGTCRILLEKLAGKDPALAFALLATTANELNPAPAGGSIPEDQLLMSFCPHEALDAILTAAASADRVVTLDWLTAHPAVMATQPPEFTAKISQPAQEAQPQRLLWNSDLQPINNDADLPDNIREAFGKWIRGKPPAE